MKEVWKLIPSCKGFYSASTLGRIRSEDRLVANVHKNGYRRIRGRVMRLFIGNSGYEQIPITINTNKSLSLVHRLVAETFIDNPDNKPCVNHLNGIKTDNYIGNLDWCTYSENEKHSHYVLGKKAIKGEAKIQSKLTESMVLEIRENKDNLTNVKLAEIYPVCRQHIGCIIRRQGWKHI